MSDTIIVTTPDPEPTPEPEPVVVAPTIIVEAPEDNAESVEDAIEEAVEEALDHAEDVDLALRVGRLEERIIRLETPPDIIVVEEPIIEPEPEDESPESIPWTHKANPFSRSN